MTFSRWIRHLWLPLACATLVIAIDQLVKSAAVANLTEGKSQPLLGDVVRLYLAYNDSAAFSIGFGQTWVFALIGGLASLLLIYQFRRLQTLGWRIMAGVALGGILGNLVDRLLRAPGFGNGHVVDYIQIPFNFPIFNLADVAIVSMAILTLLRVWLGQSPFAGPRQTAKS